MYYARQNEVGKNFLARGVGEVLYITPVYAESKQRTFVLGGGVSMAYYAHIDEERHKPYLP